MKRLLRFLVPDATIVSEHLDAATSAQMPTRFSILHRDRSKPALNLGWPGRLAGEGRNIAGWPLFLPPSIAPETSCGMPQSRAVPLFVEPRDRSGMTLGRPFYAAR